MANNPINPNQKSNNSIPPKPRDNESLDQNQQATTSNRRAVVKQEILNRVTNDEDVNVENSQTVDKQYPTEEITEDGFVVLQNEDEQNLGFLSLDPNFTESDSANGYTSYEDKLDARKKNIQTLTDAGYTKQDADIEVGKVINNMQRKALEFYVNDLCKKK